MAQSGFVWVNKISVLGSIKTNIALINTAAKVALDEHFNEVEAITKSDKRLTWGFGIKSGTMRGDYRHNPVISSGGMAKGEVFNTMEYAGYLEHRWGGKYRNFAPSIQESQVNIDKIVNKTFKNMLNL